MLDKLIVNTLPSSLSMLSTVGSLGLLPLTEPQVYGRHVINIREKMS